MTLGGKINLGRGVPPIMATPKRRGVFSGMAALGHLKVMFDQLKVKNFQQMVSGRHSFTPPPFRLKVTGGDE